MAVLSGAFFLEVDCSAYVGVRSNSEDDICLGVDEAGLGVSLQALHVQPTAPTQAIVIHRLICRFVLLIVLLFPAHIGVLSE
jgi:predicted MFS family arabinose efflux permease